jgi:hypothetical protein
MFFDVLRTHVSTQNAVMDFTLSLTSTDIIFKILESVFRVFMQKKVFYLQIFDTKIRGKWEQNGKQNGEGYNC